MPRNTRSRRTDPARQEARKARREKLLEAADTVVRREGPRVSMSAIASEAGISKPILYKHFGDKGGLYQALAQRYLQRLLEELRNAIASSEDPRDRIERTIDRYLGFIETQREAYAFLMHPSGERVEAQTTVVDFIRGLGDEISVILTDELSRLGVDTGGAEAWAHGMVGMVYIAGDRWLERPSISRRTLVDHLVTLLWGGFAQLPADPTASEGSATA